MHMEASVSSERPDRGQVKRPGQETRVVRNGGVECDWRGREPKAKGLS